MPKQFSEATQEDFDRLACAVPVLSGCTALQAAGNEFVENLYRRFSRSLVLLRLFATVNYERLPEEDRCFVDQRGIATGTAHLIRSATPIFTLIASRGRNHLWNDRRRSQHFRCIPLASTAFVSSLSMLSRQFMSVGLDLSLIDEWQTRVAASGRADRFRGILHIRDSGADRDEQGRMIVPRQEFVAENGIRTTIGVGCGYAGHPTMLTLFAFTDETFEPEMAAPLAGLLELFRDATEEMVREERLFS